MPDNPPAASAEFRVAHRAAMAERLGETLDRVCSGIGEDDAHLQSGRFGERTKFAQLTDDEVRGYIAGQRDALSTIHDWIEHQFAGDYDHDETHAATVKHGCTYEMIHRDLDGAEGENFRRRHPERSFFPGKLRRLNAWLNALRDLRIKLNSSLGYVITSTAQRSELLSQWGAESQAIARELIDLRYKCKSPEEAEARDRCERERESLGRLIYEDMKRCHERARREIEEEAENKRRAWRAERAGVATPQHPDDTRALDELVQLEIEDQLNENERAAYRDGVAKRMTELRLEGLPPARLALIVARLIRRPEARAAIRDMALAQLRGERQVAA